MIIACCFQPYTFIKESSILQVSSYTPLVHTSFLCLFVVIFIETLSGGDKDRSVWSYVRVGRCQVLRQAINFKSQALGLFNVLSNILLPIKIFVCFKSLYTK